MRVRAAFCCSFSNVLFLFFQCTSFRPIMVFATRLMLMSSRSAYQPASRMFLNGWRPTISSSIPLRLWCTSTPQQHLLTATPMQLGSTLVRLVSTVRDLGFHINSDVKLTTHVSATVRACFSVLKQIRSVRRSSTRDALITLLRPLAISKVEYCCSALAGVSGSQMNRLQSALNAAARLASIRISNGIRLHHQ